MKRILLFLTCFLTLFAGVRAEDTEISFSGLGTSGSGVAATDRTEGIFKLSFAKNSGSNAPMYYASDLRMYFGSNNGNSITIACDAGYKMTKIVFTSTGTGYNFSTQSASEGTMSISGTSNTWTGNTTSVTFQNKGTAQVRLSKAVITYVSEGGSDTQVAYEDLNQYQDQELTISEGGELQLELGTSYPKINFEIDADPNGCITISDSGLIKGVAEGVAMVTATWAADANFTANANGVDFKVTVNASTGGETPNPTTPQTVTFDFTTNNYGLPSNNTTYVTNGTSISEGDVSIELNGGSAEAWRYYNNNLRIYNKKSPTLTFSATNGVINSITWTCKSGVKFALTENGAEITQWEGSQENVTFYGGISTGNNDIQTITVTYTPKGGTDTPTLKDPDLKFSDETVEATIGQPFTEPTLSCPEGLTVTYTSSEEGVATVNSETGKVELVGEGTTIITATSDATEEYKVCTASYTLVVVDPNAPVFDEIVLDNFKNLGGSYDYDTWTSVKTGIVYAITAVKSSNSIQLNLDKGGLVVQQNPNNYVIDKIIVDYNTQTQNGRILNLYLNSLPYSDYTEAAKFSNNSLKGEIVAEIKYDGSNPVSLDVVDGTYAWGVKPASGALYVNKITVYYKQETRISANLEFEGDSFEGILGEEFEKTKLYNELNAPVVYSSSDVGVAKVDPETGDVTLLAEGTTTITAAVPADNEQYYGSASYTLTVIEKLDADYVEIIWVDRGYENAATIPDFIEDPVSFGFGLGENKDGNVPRYYNTGKSGRFYKGNILTVSLPENYQLIGIDIINTEGGDFKMGESEPKTSNGNLVINTQDAKWRPGEEVVNATEITFGGTTRTTNIIVYYKKLYDIVTLTWKTLEGAKIDGSHVEKVTEDEPSVFISVEVSPEEAAKYLKVTVNGQTEGDNFEIADEIVSLDDFGEYTLSATIEGTDAYKAEPAEITVIVKPYEPVRVEIEPNGYEWNSNGFKVELTLDGVEKNDLEVTVSPKFTAKVKPSTRPATFDVNAWREMTSRPDDQIDAYYYADNQMVDPVKISWSDQNIVSVKVPCSGLYEFKVEASKSYVGQDFDAVVAEVNIHPTVNGISLNTIRLMIEEREHYGDEYQDDTFGYPYERNNSDKLYNEDDLENSIIRFADLYVYDKLYYKVTSLATADQPQGGVDEEAPLFGKRRRITSADDLTKAGYVEATDADTTGEAKDLLKNLIDLSALKVGDASLDVVVEKNGSLTPMVDATNSENHYSIVRTKIQPTEVGTIEAEVADGEAEYYTLQGVKVQNPDKGIYIKVVAGKASKVVI